MLSFPVMFTSSSESTDEGAGSLKHHPTSSPPLWPSFSPVSALHNMPTVLASNTAVGQDTSSQVPCTKIPLFPGSLLWFLCPTDNTSCSGGTGIGKPCFLGLHSARELPLLLQLSVYKSTFIEAFKRCIWEPKIR